MLLREVDFGFPFFFTARRAPHARLQVPVPFRPTQSPCAPAWFVRDRFYRFNRKAHLHDNEKFRDLTAYRHLHPRH